MKRVKIIHVETRLFTDDSEHILSQIALHYARNFNDTCNDIKMKEDADQELVRGFLLDQYLKIYRDEQLSNQCSSINYG